jgi:regulatory protein
VPPSRSRSERAPRDIALGLLARREHSRAELARKLSAKGVGHGQIPALLDALEAERALSDERFTEAYVHMRRQRGFGPLRIRMELRERGVADGLIEAHLDTEAPEWAALAREQYRRRYAGAAPEDYRERARRARFLEGRGFAPGLIARIIEEA